MLITLEGADGVGKDSVAIDLKKRLEAMGHRAAIVNEPARDGLGKIVRELILEGGDGWDPLTELHLMVAARTDNILTKIIPMIEAGYIVICTRGPLATNVYQLSIVTDQHQDNPELIVSAMRAIGSTSLLLKANKVKEKKFHITCPLDISLQRTNARGMLDNIERKPAEYHAERARLYRQKAPIYNYIDVDNSGNVSDSVDTIMSHLDL